MGAAAGVGLLTIAVVDALTRAASVTTGRTRRALLVLLAGVELAAGSAASLAVGEGGWVVLLIPLLSIGLRSGLRVLIVVWLLAALVYLAPLLSPRPEGLSADVTSQALLERLTVVALLLLVSLVTGVLTGHLALALESAAVATATTRRRGRLLEALAVAAPGLTAITPDDRERIPQLLLNLGYHSGELWREEEDGWRLLSRTRATGSAGTARSVGALDAERLPPELSRAAQAPAVVSDAVLGLREATVAGPTPAARRFLRERGACVAVAAEVPTASRPGETERVVLVGTSATPVDEPAVQVLRLLAHTAGAGLRNAALVAQIEKARADAEHRSTHDMLTGQLNRAAFHQLLSTSGTGPDVDPSRGGFLLFCDLDGFKQVNDQLGHDAGDAVLVVFSERLTETVGSLGTTARLGGDEFTAVLPDPDVDLDDLCGRLVEAAARPITVPGGTAHIGTSIGVARIGPDPHDALRAADVAMYRAKSGGRGRWCLAGEEAAEGAAEGAGEEAAEGAAAAAGEGGAGAAGEGGAEGAATAASEGGAPPSAPAPRRPADDASLATGNERASAASPPHPAAAESGAEAGPEPQAAAGTEPSAAAGAAARVAAGPEPRDVQ